MSLTKKILLALLLGIFAGIGLTFAPAEVFTPIDTYVLNPVGEIFLNLIMMIVVPIVFVSIVLGTVGLGDPSKLGRIGVQTISFYLVTTAIALVIGLGVGLVLEPGEGGNFSIDDASYEEQAAPPIMDTLVQIIPENPVEALSTGNMLQIIAVAIFVGVALAMLGEKTSGIRNLFEQANDILIFLVNGIMKTAPYGAFALIASAIGEAGLDAIGSMFMYMLAVILALVLHGVITYSIAIKTLGKASPLKFYKAFFPAMSVAFSTSSSSATLPVSMKIAQEKLGVKKSISSFVQPLGATINMDGTAIMQAVATVFIAQVYAEPLGLSQMLMVVLTATLASIGTAGVPGVGLIMLAMVLKQVGLPVDGIALIIGVDRLLDMIRTSLNITGDAACAYIISEDDKRKNGIDEEQTEQTA
ncbi:MULTISPECIES: dicarboxylate/amino acid:cation symporter [Virgibacillus]|uniref:Proton glutamate symport protein n=1 Tax=Virgibacillus dokdonensis TaxID=302167 RepID=A0A2K9IXT9_9BACI|nr:MULTISPECIES: dicarboxylate/amino acid:cation symporter [Virgibacillus]AUJ24507.1 Proton glutamate symport protein [Virgibacillus dokdonensis]NWO14135.1 dicarboxylate/amino acid:cation symporter [Virgibacillus sp.]